MWRWLLVSAMAWLAVGPVQAKPAHPQRVIAIVVPGPDPSLQKLVKGFEEELAKKGFHEGQEVSYAVNQGTFDMSLIPQLLSQAESRNPALILTITTPVTQAAKRVIKNKDIPIVFSVVTDPVGAGILPTTEKGDGRFVGVTSLNNMPAVLKFGQTLFPHAKTVGVPYNPGETNDVKTLEDIKAAAAKVGINIRAVAVDTVGEIVPRIQSLRGVDYIYMPSSTLLISAAPAIGAAAAQINVPVIGPNPAIVKQKIAVASFGLFERLGLHAGDLAAELLRGKKPDELPVYTPTAEDHEPSFSAALMKKFNLHVPDQYKSCHCVF